MRLFLVVLFLASLAYADEGSLQHVPHAILKSKDPQIPLSPDTIEFNGRSYTVARWGFDLAKVKLNQPRESGPGLVLGYIVKETGHLPILDREQEVFYILGDNIEKSPTLVNEKTSVQLLFIRKPLITWRENSRDQIDIEGVKHPLLAWRSGSGQDVLKPFRSRAVSEIAGYFVKEKGHSLDPDIETEVFYAIDASGRNIEGKAAIGSAKLYHSSDAMVSFKAASVADSRDEILMGRDTFVLSATSLRQRDGLETLRQFYAKNSKAPLGRTGLVANLSQPLKILGYVEGEGAQEFHLVEMEVLKQSSKPSRSIFRNR